MIKINFEAEIVLNSMEYSGSSIDYLLKEVESDFVIDNYLKVGLQWQDSAADYNEVSLLISLMEDPMTILQNISAIMGIGASIYTLAKHIFKLRGTYNLEPYVNTTITTNNITINIYGANKDNVEFFKSEDFKNRISESLKSETPLDIQLDDVIEESTN